MAEIPPVCDFGWQAKEFNLPSVDGKNYTLKEVSGANGLLTLPFEKTADPATKISAPAETTLGAVSAVMPPSTSIKKSLCFLRLANLSIFLS